MLWATSEAVPGDAAHGGMQRPRRLAAGGCRRSARPSPRGLIASPLPTLPTGSRCITINDNFFPGHFPQRAIMPGERATAAGRLGPWWDGGRRIPCASARDPHKKGVRTGVPPQSPHTSLQPSRVQRFAITHPLRAGVLQVEAMAQLGGIVMIDPSNAAQQVGWGWGGGGRCRCALRCGGDGGARWWRRSAYTTARQVVEPAAALGWCCSAAR